MWKQISQLAIGALALVFAVAPVVGQSDDEVNAGVQFDFSTPGARSLALGGAFLGAADDATAAFSNPAGLLQLTKPEISVEARRWNYSIPFAERGRASGQPTLSGIDTLDSVGLGIAESEINGLSFASAVLPRSKWALALYFHQLANFETSFETQGLFRGDPDNARRLFPIRSSYTLNVRQVGVSFAYKLTDDFYLGAGISGYDLQLDSLTQRYGLRSFFAAPDFDRDPFQHFQRQTGEDEAVGYSLGFLWRVSDRVTLGGTRRVIPEFDISVFAAIGSPASPGRTFVADETVLFNLPDVAGLGLSFRVNDSLTINADVNRVYYSDLVEDFFLIFPGNPNSGEPLNRVEDFVIEDVNEWRLGLEYVFSNLPFPIALRVGGWHDPDHRLRYEGPRPFERASHFAGEDILHASFGVGIAIGSRWQLDAAADLSETVDTLSISSVYRF